MNGLGWDKGRKSHESLLFRGNGVFLGDTIMIREEDNIFVK
jgi:hypothetical protein